MRGHHSAIGERRVHDEPARHGPRAMLDAAHRSKGLLLASLAVLACTACASLPPSGSSATGANTCVGPVSYCDIFFGS
ncbi:hypothetical protein [Paraburkholderia solisilvae]|uniref:Uncharacterized protein n=1 Tax=Paraburkholderia solisilvae TaxID=624376 RepID=A0A6J5E7I8_9BURK|nr:hypothetical protein [Paraburkholderia solisilvae]CAB3761072.1 hypothetical protein LMG29739_03534 [Paraburkholderia solisilvae]